MNRLVLCVCGVVVFGMCCLVLAEGKSGGEQASLEAKLAAVKQDQLAARKAVEATNKAYFKFQHDVVYTNEVAAKLHQDIKALERELREKRERLNAITWKLPEMRELTRQREEAFARVRKLRDQEQLIRNEIKVLKTRAISGQERKQ